MPTGGAALELYKSLGSEAQGPRPCGGVGRDGACLLPLEGRGVRGEGTWPHAAGQIPPASFHGQGAAPGGRSGRVEAPGGRPDAGRSGGRRRLLSCLARVVICADLHEQRPYDGRVGLAPCASGGSARRPAAGGMGVQASVGRPGACDRSQTGRHRRDPLPPPCAGGWPGAAPLRSLAPSSAILPGPSRHRRDPSKLARPPPRQPSYGSRRPPGRAPPPCPAPSSGTRRRTAAGALPGRAPPRRRIPRTIGVHIQVSRMRRRCGTPRGPVAGTMPLNGGGSGGTLCPPGRAAGGKIRAGMRAAASRAGRCPSRAMCPPPPARSAPAADRAGEGSDDGYAAAAAAAAAPGPSSGVTGAES